MTRTLEDEPTAAEKKFRILQCLMSDGDRLQHGFINALAEDHRRLQVMSASRSWCTTKLLRLLGWLDGGRLCAA